MSGALWPATPAAEVDEAGIDERWVILGPDVLHARTRSLLPFDDVVKTYASDRPSGFPDQFAGAAAP